MSICTLVPSPLITFTLKWWFKKKIISAAWNPINGQWVSSSINPTDLIKFITGWTVGLLERQCVMRSPGSVALLAIRIKLGQVGQSQAKATIVNLCLTLERKHSRESHSDKIIRLSPCRAGCSVSWIGSQVSANVNLPYNNNDRSATIAKGSCWDWFDTALCHFNSWSTKVTEQF